MSDPLLANWDYVEDGVGLASYALRNALEAAKEGGITPARTDSGVQYGHFNPVRTDSGVQYGHL